MTIGQVFMLAAIMTQVTKSDSIVKSLWGILSLVAGVLMIVQMT